MLAFKHDIFLKLGVFYLIIFNQNIFSNNLNSIQLLVEWKFRQEYLSECSFTQNDNHFKICERWFFVSNYGCSFIIFADKDGASHTIKHFFVFDYTTSIDGVLLIFFSLKCERNIAFWNFSWWSWIVRYWSGIREVEFTWILIKWSNNSFKQIIIIFLRNNFFFTYSILLKWHVLDIVLRGSSSLMVLHQTFLWHTKYFQGLVFIETNPP